MDDQDERYLRIAIALAAQARAAGDPPYGSILVAADGGVLAEDQNTVITTRDITAHPELKLARWAARELSASAARTTTMYTSCQPCGMCTGAIERSGLGRVVFALSSQQFAELAPSGGFPRVRQDGPALPDEARRAVDGYYQRSSPAKRLPGGPCTLSLTAPSGATPNSVTSRPPTARHGSRRTCISAS